jgi:colicin import membrane protein
MMNLIRSTACGLVLAALAGCGTAPEASMAPPPVTVHSVAQADQHLAAVAVERAAIEARFAEREQVCYQKFFVNHCLDEAKERRRSALAAQRALEIEAERFKRQAKVDERDRALAKADAEYKVEEARLAAEPAPAPHEVTEAPPPRPGTLAEREARHKQREQGIAARDRMEAPERAANVESYKKRKAESEERQRLVKERLAEKKAKAEREAKAKAEKEAQAKAENEAKAAATGR